jgi:HlyD family secretion protein
MIKNSRSGLRGAALLAGVALLGGCRRAPPHAGALQGIVELDQRVLGFEVGGRVTSVKAERGVEVHAGDVLATLDDTLERTARESRQAEAEAAQAELALIKAGSRPEEIRSMEAEVRAAAATESLLRKNLARGQLLLSSGAVTPASVETLEAQLQSAAAQRQALDERLRELRNGPRRQQIASAVARTASAVSGAKLEAERVGRFELRALEDGTVLDVHVRPGEIVAGGTPVLTVADVRHPFAEVFVPQGALDGIRVGTRASAEVDGVPHRFAAQVENVGRRTEFTPRYLFSERERPNLVVRVRVRIQDPEQRLHAGIPAFVAIERGTQSGETAAATVPGAP